MSDQHYAYGGQAIVEGVMIRGKKSISIAVRRPDGTIATKMMGLSRFAKSKLKKYPIIRGVLALLDMVVIGQRAINYSADIAAEENTDTKNSSSLVDKLVSVLTITLGVGLSLAIFIFLPVTVSEQLRFLTDNYIYLNLVEGAIRVSLLIVYLLILRAIKFTNRIYAYHGAEHSTIMAYEKGLNLTFEFISKMPKEHPRCGTAFLAISTVVAVAVFSLVPRGTLLISTIERVALIPLVVGLSYELLKISAMDGLKRVHKIMIWPGIMLQKLTTSTPDAAMVEVAVVALSNAIKDDQS